MLYCFYKGGGKNPMTFERYPELDTLLLANPGAVRDYKPEWGWDRYMVGGKMFAALLTTADDCAPEYQNHPMLTVKVAPEEGNFLQRQYPDILPGYYMNKQHWISVRLDGAVPQEEVMRLCKSGYALIFAKLTKKMQKEILGE